MDRANEEKTSAVHFLRFELGPDNVRALKSGAALHLAVDHPEYTHRVHVTGAARAALLRDLV